MVRKVGLFTWGIFESGVDTAEELGSHLLEYVQHYVEEKVDDDGVREGLYNAATASNLGALILSLLSPRAFRLQPAAGGGMPGMDRGIVLFVD